MFIRNKVNILLFVKEEFLLNSKNNKSKNGKIFLSALE